MGPLFCAKLSLPHAQSRGSGPMAEDGRQGFVEASEIRFATFADATTAVGCSTLRLAEASLQGSAGTKTEYSRGGNHVQQCLPVKAKENRFRHEACAPTAGHSTDALPAPGAANPSLEVACGKQHREIVLTPRGQLPAQLDRSFVRPGLSAAMFLAPNPLRNRD